MHRLFASPQPPAPANAPAERSRREFRTQGRLILHRVGVRRMPGVGPRLDLATVRRPPRTAGAFPPMPLQAGPAQPVRPKSGPEPPQWSSRTSSLMHRAVGQGGRPSALERVCRARAKRKTPVRSPTEVRGRTLLCNRTPLFRGAQAEPSCPRQVPRARRGLGFVRFAALRGARSALHFHCRVRSVARRVRAPRVSEV